MSFLKAGPWNDLPHLDAQIIHRGPADDIDSTVALERDDAGFNDASQARKTYGMDDLLATLIDHVAMSNKILARDREEPFRQDVQGPHIRVLRAPRGIIKYIHNYSGTPVILTLSEVETADPFFKQLISAYTGLRVFIPFVRGIYCQNITDGGGAASALGVYIAGSFNKENN